MISVAEARALLLTHASAAPSESVVLADALGRTLAQTVIAPRAQPPFAASAMDGYALRASDTPGVVRVIGEANAGRAFPRSLNPGEAVRIFTGAPVPNGADTIVIQEDANRDADVLTAPATFVGRHIRAAGVDFPASAALLAPGRTLDPPALALAAAAGCVTLSVAQRPRIAILAGGDEIAPLGAHPTDAQIYESSGPGVAAYASAWGAAPTAHPPLTDDQAAIERAVETAWTNADLVVLIGGASVGEHDHARAALAALGAEQIFAKVAVQPGKPTWFAIRGAKRALGLPGNPASAFVCARLFLRPFIDALLGRDPALSLAPRQARLRTPLLANGPREHYLRAALETDPNGQLWASSFANQDSSLMSVFAQADSLIVRPPSDPARETGALIDFLPL